MKSILTLSILIQFWIFMLLSPAVFSSNKKGEKQKRNIVLTAAQKQSSPPRSYSQIMDGQHLNFEDNMAWGLNTWTHQLFSMDISNPDEIFIFDTLDFQSLAGSFGSSDTELFYLIQYPENIVKTINIVSGEISTVGDLPAPMADGIWTSLSLDASSGIFYGIAVDGSESVLYEVNINEGSAEQVLNLGLAGVISSAFDADGNLYLFDIESDSTYLADIQAGTIIPLGAAGFDGNYAQGMAYNSADDQIYLAAYEDFVGAQLRLLDRNTGATSILASLPGETAAYDFPKVIENPEVFAGDDQALCADQSLYLSQATASNFVNLEWTSSGDGTFDDPTLLHATYFPGAADLANGSTELCLNAFGSDGLLAASDCLIVNLQNIPLAFAGADFTITSNDSYTCTEAEAQHYTNLAWTSSGDGTFDLPESLKPVYSPGSNDIQMGEVELCLYAQPISPCQSEISDCMILTIIRLPSGIDFGDAPEQAGNPFSFPTTLANNGAAHTIDPYVYLGEKIDGEADGQPDANALGDDNDIFYPSAGDDEDGVLLPGSAAPGTQVSFTAKASVDGYLDAWMDFDHDQSWLNPSEHIFEMQPLTAGANALSFMIPPTAATGQTILRFRFRSSPVPLSFSGMANDGEVEDYTILLKENNGESMDYGDAPDGFNNKHYKTSWVNDGARHQIVEGVFLGAKVDAEIDGQPGTDALGDDNDIFFPSAGDDEDGVELPEILTSGTSADIMVVASVDGYLDAWLDCDLNGDWSGENEHLLNTYSLNAGSNSITLNIPMDADAGISYLRFRFRDNAAPLTWYGYTKGGEVEDYRIEIVKAAATEFDFGDAPEGIATGLFPVTQANNGAQHQIVSGVYLGAKVDAEPDGQPSLGATGDDTDMIYPSNGDDEDGITFAGPLIIGSTASVTVTASVDGFLSAWIDFDLDGNWDNNTEQIFDLAPLSAGTNTLTFAVPDSALAGLAYSRFRFQENESPLSFDGMAQSGEVEDYAIQIQENTSTGWDFGDAPDAIYPTSLAQDGARHLNNGSLFLGSLIDTETDGISSSDAKGDDQNYLDDEDGIVFQNPLIVGRTAYIQVVASADARLNAWLDLNDGNNWTGDAAHIFSDYYLEAGSHSLSFDIPDEAMIGETFLRFRLSTQSGLSFIGEAADGEVEDYRSAIYPDWLAQPTPLVHTISVPANLPPLQAGDLLGLFFMDNDGNEQPAGSLVVSQGQFNQILAYGDDPATPNVKEGFAVGEMLNWKLFNPETGQEHQLSVVYDSAFPDYQGTFRPFGFSALKQINYQQNPCEMPTDWVFATTGTTHNINIPLAVAPEIFGVPLQAGNWIGVFYQDDNAEQHCGGAVQWNDVAGVVLTAFGDDPATTEKDGFAPGESLRWKLYSCDSTEIFSAQATYNAALPCQGDFASFCLSELSTLQARYQQNIALSNGWNSISSYLIPANPDVENIFAPYADNLTIIQNLTSLYWPYAEVNTIGNWDNNSGYALKLSADINLEFYGFDLAPQELELSPGWHYLPVLSSCPVDADELLNPVMDKISLVQDIIGTEVWWPAMGVYTLQTLVPGRAYKIRVEESLSLTFAPCDNLKTSLEQTQGSNRSETPWGELIRTPGSHTIALPVLTIPDLSPGDCIGAVDADGNLFGFVEVGNTSENKVLMVYGDDGTTSNKDGFAEGEAIYFKLQKQSGETKMLDVVFDSSMPDTEAIFSTHGLSAIKAMHTGLDADEDYTEYLNIYPNPSNGIFQVDGMPADARLTILDARGKTVLQVQGVDKNHFDLRSLPRGIYYLRIVNNTTIRYEKLILN